MAHIKLKINDIINYNDAKGVSQVGYVSDIIMKENQLSFGRSFSRFAVVRSPINGKMKKVNILLTKATLEKYNVQLRYRHGMDDYTHIPANSTPIIE